MEFFPVILIWEFGKTKQHPLSQVCWTGMNCRLSLLYRPAIW